ncbi:metallophosphoesterase [Gammaproteobacteria bacterium]|nr:metallophosphoesterase [Gammaproteobacteria bacterium]
MKNLFLTLLILISFICGLLVGVYKLPPYQFFFETKKLISQKLMPDNNLHDFTECNVMQTTSIKDNSHIFIGHAYGSSNNNNDEFISSYAHDFIIKNKNNFNKIIFTGDVFNIPSLEKWKKLRHVVGDEVNILIAPGNHDVGRSDSSDIFNLTEFSKYTYPFLNEIDDTALIVEDSLKSEWLVSKATAELAKNTKFKKVIIARHHIPVKELLPLANSQAFKSDELDSIHELIKKFDNERMYFWVIGDGGAFKNLPRTSCLKYENHTFIINGLGNISGDSVIIYDNQNFLRYAIT